MPTDQMKGTALGQRAQALYERLRPSVETPENLGKLIVLDVESGDYEIDDLGIDSSFRLQARHPGAPLYALRIGYKTVESFAGVLERTKWHPGESRSSSPDRCC